MCKVAVVVVTYNHERFVAENLRSILAQKVNFDFKIIVADDGSTDKTVSIVEDVMQQYPNKITLLKHSQNKGVLQNAFRILPTLNCPYFAILDGDDKWNFEDKLQYQIDFLEQNADFNGIFHDAKIEHVDEAQERLFGAKKFYSQSYTFKEVISPQDLLSRKFILPSSSAVLRTSALKEVDKNALTDSYSILWKLTCFLIKHSKFYFINEPWSTYRNHTKGISKSDNTAFHLSHIRFLEFLLQDLHYKEYPFEIYEALTMEYQVLLNHKESTLNKRRLFRQYKKIERKKVKYYKKKVL